MRRKPTRIARQLLPAVGLLLVALLGLLWATQGGAFAAYPREATGGGPAAPLACQSGTNKTGNPPVFDTGQITFCPNESTVYICDYFTTQNGGCPGDTRLADTDIQITCVAGCTNNQIFNTSTCVLLTGVTP